MSTDLRIRYFALARERVGSEADSLASRPGDTVAAVRARLAQAQPVLADLLPLCRIAVNDDFARDDEPVPPGAEVLVLPPASGGAACASTTGITSGSPFAACSTVQWMGRHTNRFSAA